MPLSFLTRPVLRLRADGGAEAPGPREPALGPPTVWIARGLCRFERVRTPPGLSARAALAAARLHAQTRGPFLEAGRALARLADGGWGVWWWDAAVIAARLKEAGVTGPLRLRPEAAGQAAPADGWRVLRGDGWEAQHWIGGALAASAWRRTAFDDESWRTFIRAAPGGGTPAPAAPPAPHPPVFTRASGYGRRFAREGEWTAALPAVAAGLAAVSLGAASFFAGQGLAASRRDDATRAEISAREAVAPRNRRPELMARARGLEALGRLVDRPGPLAHLEEAQRILSRFGLRVTGFDAGSDEVSVSVPASAAAGVDLLVEALEDGGRFTDVRPTLDRDAHVLTLRMRPTA